MTDAATSVDVFADSVLIFKLHFKTENNYSKPGDILHLAKVWHFSPANIIVLSRHGSNLARPVIHEYDNINCMTNKLKSC